jgi:hypothetical protein
MRVAPCTFTIRPFIPDGTFGVVRASAEPLAILKEEGGRWQACPDGEATEPVAVLFEDGMIYDQFIGRYNGRYGSDIDCWRKIDYRPRIRVQMGRAVI